MIDRRGPSPMGRAMLIVVRLVSLFIVLAAVGLVLSSFFLFYPTPPSLPLNPASFTSRYDASTGTFHLEGNLTMTVQGVYDVEDVTLGLLVKNKTGFNLVNLTKGPFTLHPKAPHTEHVDMAIDLNRWLATGANPLLNPDELAVKATVGGRYTAGFVRALGALTIDVPWSPPVNQLLIDTANATKTTSGSTFTFSVPYTVGTANYLTGSATVDVSLENASATMASTSASIPLGTTATGLLNFTMPVSTAAANAGGTVTVVTKVTLPGGLAFTVRRQIQWSYP